MLTFHKRSINTVQKHTFPRLEAIELKFQIAYGKMT